MRHRTSASPSDEEDDSASDPPSPESHLHHYDYSHHQSRPVHVSASPSSPRKPLHPSVARHSCQNSSTSNSKSSTITIANAHNHSSSTARCSIKSRPADLQSSSNSKSLQPIWDSSSRPNRKHAAFSPTITSPSRSSQSPSSSMAHGSRLRDPWACSWLLLGVLAVSTGLLATLYQSFSTRQLDAKGGSMSYMASSFVPFHDFDTEHTRFASKYALYMYRERGIDEDPRVGEQAFQ